MSLQTSCVFILLTFGLIYCLYVVPERAVVTYVNEKYVSNASWIVKRYSRKSLYYFNVEGIIKHTWNNNVSIHLIFFEYLRNEYRRSFVEMHFKACEFINSEPYVGGMLAKNGITCPISANFYKLQNMTVNMRAFPNVWPFEKGRVDVSLNITTTGEGIAAGYTTLLFKKKL